jgi:hypothetical protein
MTNTKIGERGLRDEDIEERDKLSQKLEKAFSEVEDCIGEINSWVDEMREKFQAYYTDRSDDWKESKDGPVIVYESFTNKWDNFKEQEEFESKLEEMRDLLETWVLDLKNLPVQPGPRPKKPKVKQSRLFRRNL